MKIAALHRAPRPPPPPRFLILSPNLPATQRGPCGRERDIAARVIYKLPHDLPSVHVRKSVKLDSLKWRIQGRGPGGPGPPSFFDQTEARRAENIFGETALPHFSQGLNPALRYVTCTGPR